MQTQVGIVGAGPAGLLLSALLHDAGIESVILEARSREYALQRVRAGLLEQSTVELLTEAGLADRLHRERLVHQGIELRYGPDEARERHRVPITELTGREVTIYGQQEVVADLIAARESYDGPIYWEAADVTPTGLESDPRISFVHDGARHELHCDYIVGADGFHGVCRGAVPDGALTTIEHEYDFGWLGILAHVKPSCDELIYANHARGFALHSMRSDTVSRLYIQVPLTEKLEDWPDRRVWDELHTRLQYPGWELAEGEVFDKSIAPLRSFVVSPMQYGKLFLAGDAAHIVPPTGAKGLNLAVHDVHQLRRGLVSHYADGSDELLAGYTDRCLERVWRAQDFSTYMTHLLHNMSDDPFDQGLQQSRLRYAWTSAAAATALAENYAGLPFDR
ncbi:MAG TPA: 4-hydroxybenzoate 3-monooxygenase [Baekduia sp.]|nr:4-hydroxybenzoate 3-monooxygenase [Baekduia sp.]